MEKHKADALASSLQDHSSQKVLENIRKGNKKSWLPPDDGGAAGNSAVAVMWKSTVKQHRFR